VAQAGVALSGLPPLVAGTPSGHPAAGGADRAREGGGGPSGRGARPPRRAGGTRVRGGLGDGDAGGQGHRRPAVRRPAALHDPDAHLCGDRGGREGHEPRHPRPASPLRHRDRGSGPAPTPRHHRGTLQEGAAGLVGGPDPVLAGRGQDRRVGPCRPLPGCAHRPAGRAAQRTAGR